jgi:N-acetylglucosaminyl-diphospho-decaprenol L-rhamnosyltransferase
MTDIPGEGRDTLSFDVDDLESFVPMRAVRGSSASSGGAGMASVVVIIVGFHNAADVVGCLHALSRLDSSPPFEVFIAENGGIDGVAAMRAALVAPASPCQSLSNANALKQIFPDLDGQTLILSRQDKAPETRVHLVQMSENFGYAGAINACLRPLLLMPGWDAVWILNPDTEPTPSALCELADYAAKRKKGMVGSRITAPAEAAVFCCRGLKWSKLTASTTAIGLGDDPTDKELDPDVIEPLLDSPSGASMYVTRELIQRIGLMDERYFLYFEDLDWGCRAKGVGALGYAHRSVVPHKGGTTIGSASDRTGKSRLSVYLEFRNRILFVRARHGHWLAWTALMQLVHLAVYFASGSVGNMFAGGRGVLAGLRGEVGRPDRILQAHRAL